LHGLRTGGILHTYLEDCSGGNISPSRPFGRGGLNFFGVMRSGLHTKGRQGGAQRHKDTKVGAANALQEGALEGTGLSVPSCSPLISVVFPRPPLLCIAERRLSLNRTVDSTVGSRAGWRSEKKAEVRGIVPMLRIVLGFFPACRQHPFGRLRALGLSKRLSRKPRRNRETDSLQARAFWTHVRSCGTPLCTPKKGGDPGRDRRLIWSVMTPKLSRPPGGRRGC
jgi:hypothetical protein